MSGQPRDPRLRDLMREDATVCTVMNAGGDVIDALQALSRERQRLLGELVNMQSLIGHRYLLPGGVELIWRPPDEALPVSDLSTSSFCKPRPSENHDTIRFMGHEYVRSDLRIVPAPATEEEG